MKAFLRLLAIAAFALACSPALAGPIGNGVSTLNGPTWPLSASTMDLDFQYNRAAINTREAGLATGQLAITRATSGYAQLTSTGCLQTFPSGAFRQTDKGLLIEETRTNNALWARDMTNAAWVKVNVTTAQTAVGADCTANSATQLTSTLANGTVLQTITLGSSADTYDVWLQRVSGTGNIQISDDGITWTTVTLATNYQQFQVTQTLANPTFGIRLVASGDIINADFSQLEPGSFATSPIATTTVAATRNADQVTFAATGSGLIQGAQGSVLAVTGPLEVASLNEILTRDGTNHLITVSNSGSARSRVASTNVTATLGTSGYTTIPVKTAMSWAASSNSLVGNNGTVGTGTLNFSGTTPFLGSNSGTTSFMDGYVQRLVLWNSRLSDGQIKGLTQ